MSRTASQVQSVVSGGDASPQSLKQISTLACCKNGHSAPCFSNGRCIECTRIRRKAYYDRPDAAEIRATREFKAKNRERVKRSQQGGFCDRNAPPPRVAGQCDLCEELKDVLRWDRDHMLEGLFGYKDFAQHRGWLCMLCDTGLAKLGDEPTKLKAALDYLSRKGRFAEPSVRVPKNARGKKFELAPRIAGQCDLCERPSSRTLARDHDPVLQALGFSEIEQQRGRLCMRCNTGLGKLRDNAIGLQRALEYVSYEGRFSRGPSFVSRAPKDLRE
jgi:hypothetical protein